MNMNKSLTAVAVAGVIAMPMSQAQAQPEGWYGFIAAGIESSSISSTRANAIGVTSGGSAVDQASLAVTTDGSVLSVTTGGSAVTGLRGGAAIFHTNRGDDGEGNTGMSDIAESRFGFGGSEDLGGGLEAMYGFEFGLRTSGVGGGSVNQGVTVQNRLSYLGLAGDFGSITIGQQWGTLYEFMGWNTYRNVGHGLGAWYYHTGTFNQNAYGLRVSNSVQYTYGGGGYSDDPFTFRVEGVFDDTTYTSTGGDTDSKFLDSLSIAGAGTFDVGAGSLTINALFQSEQGTNGADNTFDTFGIGGRFASGPFVAGVTYLQSDIDSGGVDGDPSSLHLMGQMDFGNGLTGRLNFGMVDGDDIVGFDDMDSNVSVALEQALSSRTFVDVEYETVDYDNIGDESVFYAGLRHTF